MLEIRKDFVQERYVLYTVYDVINDNLIYDYFIETVDDAKKGNSFLKEPKLRREFSIIVNEHCSHLNNNYSIKVSNNEHIEIKPKYSVFVEENNIQKQISLLETRNSIVPFFDALKSFNQSVIHGENREMTTFEGKKILLKFNAVEE